MNNLPPKLPVEPANGVRGVVPIHSYERADMLYPSEIGYYEEPENKTIDFWSIVRILLSRKWMILALTIAGVAASVALTLRETPMFVATATIEVQREEMQIIEGSNVGPEIIADATYMETQFRLLRSRFLAERVAEELNLPNDPRYASPDLPRDLRLRQAASQIVTGLRVAPAGNSRIVSVRFVSPYRTETARIVNAVTEAFIASNLERKYNNTAFARDFLDERLDVTKKALEASELRLVQYAEEQGLLDIGGSTNGAGSLSENSIVTLNNELSLAEGERIRAEQEYRTALETPAFRELLQSNSTLGGLRERLAALRADYQELSVEFKPDYPDMVNLQSRINSVEQQIELETEAMIASLRVDYEAATAREVSLRERVEELREGLLDERNRRVEYQILQREVETIRSQYQGLLQRSKEVSISSGIGSSNIAVVDEALAPSIPFQPNLSRSALQALIMSFGLAVGLAFALHFIDDTIKTAEDLRNKLGIAVIGVIPKMSSKRDAVLDSLDDPRSSISEAFASARTALEFATEEGAPRSLLITSTRPGEGKTSTTIALATVFAKGGKSVLIIDGDMRKPSFVVDTNKSIGLSGLLTGHEHLSAHVVQTKTDGLSILPAGVVPPNPAQLLSGPRLREIIDSAHELFDLVIVDSPPVLSFTDSPRLGSVVSGVLVVIQSGAIRTPAVQRTLTLMSESRAEILGGVLTKFDAKKSGYDYSYYYSGYSSDAYKYVESDSRRANSRKILIESVSDDAKERERWG